MLAPEDFLEILNESLRRQDLNVLIKLNYLISKTIGDVYFNQEQQTKENKE